MINRPSDLQDAQDLTLTLSDTSSDRCWLEATMMAW